LEAAPAPGEIAVSLGESGAVRVPVVVNDRGPFNFLLDTGSSHTTIGRGLAERLALPVVAQARVLMPSGVGMQPVVRLDLVAIGDARVTGLMPSVVSLELPGVDGVIGQDFLSRFDYTVDYRRKRLRWAAEPGGGLERLPLVRAGERRLVQLPGHGKQGPLLLVPDSGAEGFVVFERQGRTAVRVQYADHEVLVSGLASRRAGRGARLPELQVGAVTVFDQAAVVLERDGPRAVEGDLLLPLHRFSLVSFSNSEGYLVVRR
jgi:hypothetical protein